MRIFQRLDRRKAFNQLSLKLILLQRSIMISLPIKIVVDANRLSHNEPKESELVASIPVTPGSIKTRKISGSHDFTAINGISTIVHDPALSLLFRDFLEKTHCWENLAFYLEVTNTIDHYDQIRHTLPRLHTSHSTQASLNRK